jgi:hypothetical protein
MIYVALVCGTVLTIWFVGKFSKFASSLAALIGCIMMCLGVMASHLSTIFCGMGLVAFSALIFMVFNQDNW